jgi:hypothetical protein
LIATKAAVQFLTSWFPAMRTSGSRKESSKPYRKMIETVAKTHGRFTSKTAGSPSFAQRSILLKPIPAGRTR